MLTSLDSYLPRRGEEPSTNDTLWNLSTAVLRVDHARLGAGFLQDEVHMVLMALFPIFELRDAVDLSLFS